MHRFILEPSQKNKLAFHGKEVIVFSADDQQKILEFSAQQEPGEKRYDYIEQGQVKFLYDHHELLRTALGNGRLIGFIGFTGETRNSDMLNFKSKHYLLDPVPHFFDAVESPTWSGLLIVAKETKHMEEVTAPDLLGKYMKIMHDHWE